MIAAGKQAYDKWKTQPIGGEIRPEVWGCVFDNNSCAPKGQEFEKCVARMHVSWLMDSGMFGQPESKQSKERFENATKQVQKMGYELFVRSATFSKTKEQVSIKLSIDNKGVAPFYYDWPIEVLILDESEKTVGSKQTNWKLSETLPGSEIRWETKLNVAMENFANMKVAIRVVHPMQGGKPFRFANSTQRDDGLLIIRQ